MNPPALPVYRWTRKKYEHVVQEGGFSSDDRIELLDGLLVLREPQGDRHAAAVSALQIALARAFGRRFHVRTGAPVALDPASEPEPDLAVVPGKPWDYGRGHPSKPVLVAEVADTSLATDRLHKGPIYARAGLTDYWIVNLVDEVLEVYRRPGRDASWPYGWKYGSLRVYRRGDFVIPRAKPRARVRVASLLP